MNGLVNSKSAISTAPELNTTLPVPLTARRSTPGCRSAPVDQAIGRCPREPRGFVRRGLCLRLKKQEVVAARGGTVGACGGRTREENLTRQGK